MRWIFLLFLCLALPLCAEEELVVRVGAENVLEPLYMHMGGSSELESVLRFDMDHNGRTQVISGSKECVRQVAKENSWNTFYREGWEALKVPYVLKAQVKEGKLSAAIFSVRHNRVKGIEGVALSGNLAKDRQKVHEVADTLHEALFGVKGIASSRILYTVRSGQEEGEVWECDYDGANVRQVTHEGHLCISPICASGADFMYVSYRIGQPKIFAAHVSEGVGKRFSFLRGNQLTPCISAKGDRVAFISDITGNPELFLQECDPQGAPVGKPQQIFSAPNGAQGCPTFSPDGKQIAFVSNKDGTPRIYVMDIPAPRTSVKDLKPRIVTKRNRANTCPSWSPDGKKLAYASTTDGVRQIWIYEFATGEETQLSTGPSHKENPAWAPNSLHLLFNTVTKTGAELYLVNLNQRDMVKISKGNGEKRFPAWRRV